MSRVSVGFVCCLSFVFLEAFQAVYLGTLFQRVDSFLIGAWVFGLAGTASLGATILFRPFELVVSMSSVHLVVGLNVLAAVTWITYFYALQLIEPTVVFTIFSGMVPLGTLLAAKAGFVDVNKASSRLLRLGYTLILISLILLAGATVIGLSGFVRGNASVALLGVAFSAISGSCTAFVIVFSVRLSKRGVGPLAQFGLRFVLYTLLAVLAFNAGVDEKAMPLPAYELTVLVVIGLFVIALPLYLVQKAVPLLPANTIAAVTAMGPAMVYAMQMAEGRVCYAQATVLGLSVYISGALMALAGECRSGRNDGFRS